MRRFPVAVLVLFAVSFPSSARAQITNVTNDQATPTPGIGHNYIGTLNEIVNPANGSLSIRLDVPIPKGRGIGVPFHFLYNSSGVFRFQTTGNFKLTAKGGADQGFMEHAGWGYSVPTFNSGVTSIPSQNPVYPNGSCPVNTEFVFTDEEGSRHSLPLAIANQSQCSQMQVYPSLYYSTSDDVYAAWTQNGAQDAYTVPFSVQDKSGTVYHFSQLGNATGTGGLTWQCLEACSIPDFIEDRNGNKVTFSAGSYGIPLSETDTAGRPALSISAFGSTADLITTSGMKNPFTVDWGKTATYNFTFTANSVLNDSECGTLTLVQPTGSFTAVSSITMPNGKEYQFSYDSNYGLVSEIIYPTGGYVKYTWGMNNLADTTYWTDSKGNFGACGAQYSSPAILHRYVSFDGTTVALQQDFAYTTNWNPSNPQSWLTKQTIVTTTDLTQSGHPSFQTTYTYTPVQISTPPDIWQNPYEATQVPQEQTIVYKNWDGSTLQTVNKTWASLYTLGSQQTTLDNGQTNKVAYSYQGLSVMSEKDEYDFGSGGSPGPLLRKTVLNFSAPVANPLSAKIWDRPSSVIVYDGSSNRVSETDYTYDQTSPSSASATNHDETYFSPTYRAPRGNATTVTRQCFPGCAAPSTTYTYDETGQALSVTDPCGNTACSDMTGTSHTTGYSYADNYSSCAGAAPPSGNTNAYLTKVTDPLGHITSYCYGYNDGQERGSTDQNSQTTTYAYSDALGRLTSIVYPTPGGETLYTYNDSPPSPSVTTQQEISAGTFLTTVKVTDGMGHVTETELTSDPSGADRTVTTYNGLGKPYFVYNPTRCSTPTTNCGESTWGYTAYTYDALGRAKLVTNPDNSTVQTSYIGRATEVTDEGNGTKSVQRISQTDALGRLNSVCEVSGTTLSVGASPAPTACGQDIGGTGFLTSYQYDILGDLKGVSQAGLNPRAFSYDSLSRLTNASNPESGSTCYGTVSAGVCQNNGYDANGNVVMKTDARGVTTTSTYDALNRLTQKSYSDGTPTANFFYDATVWHNINLTNTVGRLSYEGALSGSTYLASEAFSYDSMGRVINNSQCTIPGCPNGPYSVTYGYDLLGDMTSTSPGAPVTYMYAYNSAAQLTGVTSSLVDANHPSSLLSNVLYNPAGSLSSAFMGTNSSTSGISESRTYNNRLRTVVISTGVNTPTGFMGLVGMTYGYAPNGDVTSLADGPTGNWNFYYDDFNRLQSTVVPNYPTSPYAYVYDRYGNRWKQTANGTCTAGTAFCISFDANNHVTGGILTYDTAGNVIADNMHHYTYDAENRLTQVDAGTTASYVYDASGRRMQKTTAGTTVNYIYDLNGRVVTEYGSTGVWNRGEIYAGSRHLVTYRNSLTYFSSVDALGSERVRSTQNESSYESCDSLPFGDDQYCFGSATGNVSPLHFTGKERDTESNLDNFEARYMASSLGRFMSPDPNNSSGFDNQDDPQSWNGYSYARNNPLLYTDPSGEKYKICDNSGNCQFLSDVQFGNDFQTNPNVQLTASQIYIQDSNGNFNLEGTYHAGSSDDSTGGPQNDFLGESLIGAFAGGVASAGRGLVSGLLESGSEQAAMAEVRAAGQLGEELAGIVKNTERIRSVTGAAYRVPDILDHGAQVIGEVKNYNGTLSLTAQIRDDLAYAAQNPGYQMILKVSQSTTFTQPLQRLVDSGVIQVIRF